MTAPARVEMMDRRAPGGTWLAHRAHRGAQPPGAQDGRRRGAPGDAPAPARATRASASSKLAAGRWRPLTRAEWTRLGAMVGLER